MSQEAAVAGERTVAQVGKTHPRAVRVQRRLALMLVGVVGTVILVWYYLHIADESRARNSALSSASKAAAASEMKLPGLDLTARSPAVGRPKTTPADAAAQVEPSSAAAEEGGALAIQRPTATPIRDTRERRSAEEGILANARLAQQNSPVLIHSAVGGGVGPGGTTGPLLSDPVGEREVDAVDPGANRPLTHGAASSGLAEALVATVTTPVQAALVPTRRWLLAKGTFLDCTLETAIDSTLVGMTSCILATDVFGADGRVVLLERGTKLIGETRGGVRAGQARIAILWSEARTPTGVVVGLASPGTDALGRAGVPGVVDAHATERFGAAVLLTLIDGAITAVASRQQGSGSVIYNAQGTRDVATEALRHTIDIPPTVRVSPGARVQVLVARDVDFRGVYRLISRAEH